MTNSNKLDKPMETLGLTHGLLKKSDEGMVGLSKANPTFFECHDLLSQPNLYYVFADAGSIPDAFSKMSGRPPAGILPDSPLPKGQRDAQFTRSAAVVFEIPKEASRWAFI